MGLSSGSANNKGAEQPAHPPSLIRAFVIHFLERIISRLPTSEISIFYLVSTAEQAGLNFTVGNPENRFSCDEAHIIVERFILLIMFPAKIVDSFCIIV